MNLLFVVMKDGSVFQMPNELWQKAFSLECADPSNTIQAFKEITHGNWLKLQKRWKNKYKNEAEFGKEIMYNYIHHALTAIELHKRAIKEERSLTPEVIVSEDRGLTVYTGVSKKKYESVGDYLAEKQTLYNRRELTVDEKLKLLIKERIRKKAKELFIADAKAGRLGPLLSKIPMLYANLKALGYWKRAEKQSKTSNRFNILGSTS